MNPNLITAISLGLLSNNLIQDNYGISRENPYNISEDCNYTKNDQIFYNDEKET